MRTSGKIYFSFKECRGGDIPMDDLLLASKAALVRALAIVVTSIGFTKLLLETKSDAEKKEMKNRAAKALKLLLQLRGL